MTDGELKERLEYLGFMIHEKEMKEQAFLEENKELFDEIEQRKDQIRKEILARGEGADSRTLKATYRKGAVRWDTKWLDGYSTAHPEILKYRKQGEPSVSFSLKPEGMGE
jgi:hypothetical protein